jgi:hypothetical protein
MPKELLKWSLIAVKMINKIFWCLLDFIKSLKVKEYEKFPNSPSKGFGDEIFSIDFFI